MYEVKLPYYPSKRVTAYQTRYGLVEIDKPKIYEEPIAGRKLARIDTIYFLYSYLGADMSMCRDFMYDIVAGNLPDKRIHTAICMFYRVMPKFRELVNNIYFYQETGSDFFDVIFRHMLNAYNDYVQNVSAAFRVASAKQLVYTHGYIYYSLHKVAVMPDLKGITIIC